MIGSPRTWDWDETPSLVALARVLARRVAVVGGGAPAAGGAVDASSPASEQALDALLPQAAHWVLLIIDGLGSALLERLPAASFLRAHRRADLRSLFPSSTAASMTSLVTGRWPGEHGLLGWWTYLPEVGVTTKPMHFTTAGGRQLDRDRFAPLLFDPVAPIRPHAEAATLYFPAAYLPSAYADFLAGGGHVLGYRTLADVTAALQARVRSSPASFSLVYYPDLDGVVHASGVEAETTWDAFRRLDANVAAMSAALGGRATLLATADHGQVEGDSTGDIVLERDDPLLAFLAARPSGERRVPFFHVRPGCVDEFRRMFEARFRHAWRVVDAESVARSGLLGPCDLRPEVRARLGDFIALTDTSASFRLATDRPQRAVHGGLAEREMTVPLIVA